MLLETTAAIRPGGRGTGVYLNGYTIGHVTRYEKVIYLYTSQCALLKLIFAVQVLCFILVLKLKLSIRK